MGENKYSILIEEKEIEKFEFKLYTNFYDHNLHDIFIKMMDWNIIKHGPKIIEHDLMCWVFDLYLLDDVEKIVRDFGCTPFKTIVRPTLKELQISEEKMIIENKALEDLKNKIDTFNYNKNRFGYVYIINFSNKKLKHIPEGLQNFTILHKLYLEGNELDTDEVLAFKGLEGCTALKKISFDYHILEKKYSFENYCHCSIDPGIFNFGYDRSGDMGNYYEQDIPSKWYLKELKEYQKKLGKII